jgi:7,8-dihydro-6-hydroxymethylpterin-pyrophosphokinase
MSDLLRIMAILAEDPELNEQVERFWTLIEEARETLEPHEYLALLHHIEDKVRRGLEQTASRN